MQDIIKRIEELGKEYVALDGVKGSIAITKIESEIMKRLDYKRQAINPARHAGIFRRIKNENVFRKEIFIVGNKKL